MSNKDKFILKDPKQELSEELKVYLKQHKKYPSMFYYLKDSGKFSRSYYNYTRAYYYANVPKEVLNDFKQVGTLPYELTEKYKVNHR